MVDSNPAGRFSKNSWLCFELNAARLLVAISEPALHSAGCGNYQTLDALDI